MQLRENNVPGLNFGYSYDAKGQITGAVKRSADGTALPGLNYGYSYDEIGNRLTATEGAVSNLYSSNLLNQYTSINATHPTYDLDGNMLTDGKGWTFSYNGENRLITATNGNARIEMNYDTSGRRFEKKVYNGATLTKHERFVCNGFKLVEVRDGLNANALTKSFTWQERAGLDTPLSMKYNGQTGYYQLDGNKNVLKVTAQDGTVLANYTYGPLGQVLTSSGTWKDLNPWQFSSEYFDAELGLVYYNYRHYCPTLGRWTTRDPIEENGGVNLYGMVENDIANYHDWLGALMSGNALEELENQQILYNLRNPINLLILPDIARARGWKELAGLFDIWFNNHEYVIDDGTRVDLAAPYDDKVITMSWILSFSRSKEVYNRFLDEKIFVTDKFKKLLKDKFINRTGDSFTFGDDIFSMTDPRKRHQEHWQSFSVPTNKNLYKMDALDAALHQFTLAGIFAGKYFPRSKKVCLSKVGIYAKDQFVFSEEQYLGNWNKPDKVDYFIGRKRQSVSGEVTNRMFREYRSKTQKGQDFFVFSDMKIENYSKPIVIDLSK